MAKETVEEKKREDLWKTLKSEIVLARDPWLRVRHDVVELPDGRVNPEFYVTEYADWVNVIAVTEDGRYIMERQYRHGLGVTCLEICAGCMEPGETPEEGARRELEEETGYGGGEWHLLMTISSNPSVTNNLTYCYVALGVKKISGTHLDETEDLEVLLMEREEVYAALMSDGIKQALMAAPLWRWFSVGLQGRE